MKNASLKKELTKGVMIFKIILWQILDVVLEEILDDQNTFINMG